MKKDLSLYIDNELAANKIENFFADCQRDVDFRNDWFYCHFLGDAMRGQSTLDNEYSLRIIEKINNTEIDRFFDPLSSKD